MVVANEDAFPIEIGFGLYSAELPSGIPNGYCQEVANTVCSGESQENRLGITYQANVDYYVQQPVTPEHNAFVSLYTDNPSYPVIGWPDGNFLCFIRGSARLYASSPAGAGFMRVNPDSSVMTSVANYGAITYYSNALGIKKITSFDWVTSTIPAPTLVSNAVNSLYGMFTFKDRMWGFKGNTIYFTNAATSTVLPETWSAVTQSIPVEGPGGSGEILRVVPIGSRLIIFTSNGLYALTVAGEPASWVFKTLDNRSLGNHRQCAFERNNLIYYVNTLGVYVTDGYEVTKLSSSIDDKFTGSITGSVRYSLNFLNDGMLLSMSRVFKHTDNQLYYETPYHTMYYTRLDTIAWSEWNLTNYEDPALGVYADNKIATILSTSDSIYTFLSPDPLSLMLLVAGNSKPSAQAPTFFQLCTYDGHENVLRCATGSSGLLEEAVHIKIRSSFTDFGQAYNITYVKYAFAEVFTNDANYDFETWWVIDGTTDAQQSRLTKVQGPTPGEGTNLVKISADFKTRRGGMSLRTYLQTPDSQVKFKNFIGILHTERREFKDIR